MPRSAALDAFVAAVRARDEYYGHASISPMWKADTSRAYVRYKPSVQGVPPRSSR